MIVEFSVKNFRSIKELQTISFVATGLKSPAEYSDIDKKNITEESNMRLLKTVGLYGANASGKSNIIKALEYFLKAIKNQASSDSNLSSLCEPFLYQENAIETESFFQIVLIIKNKKYRYGFTIKRNPKIKGNLNEKISKEVIVNEWLYGTKGKNLVKYFTRSGLSIDKENMPNKDKIPDLPYEHSLFLTHVAAFDKTGDCSIIKYNVEFGTSSFVIDINFFRSNVFDFFERKNIKKDFLELLSSFNLKYNDIIIDKEINKPEQIILPLDKIYMIKSYNNINNKTLNIKLNLSHNESSGTKKLFDLAGLLLIIFKLPISVCLIIDEIDSNFHPSLLIKLIELFNNPKINLSKSQLLFTSHDTNLMSPSIMRRDQFYFTEKNEDDSTKLYSLADLKGIRNDADFAKQYLAGFYGALPILTDYINDNISPNE